MNGNAPNIDRETVEGFGEEWAAFDQESLPGADLSDPPRRSRAASEQCFSSEAGTAAYPKIFDSLTWGMRQCA